MQKVFSFESRYDRATSLEVRQESVLYLCIVEVDHEDV